MPVFQRHKRRDVEGNGFIIQRRYDTTPGIDKNFMDRKPPGMNAFLIALQIAFCFERMQKPEKIYL